MNTRSLLVTASLASLLLVGCGAKSTEAPPPEFASKDEIMTQAEAGNSRAQFELGAMYHDGQAGTTKDLAKAKEWFEKSAAQGEQRSQFNLGVMYYMGEGIQRNFSKAREWFEKSSDAGNMRAQFNLGVMYYRAEGISQDYKKALDLFTKSAIQGFHEAQFNLGVMNAKGEGKEQDIGQAYAWFVAAKNSGNPDSAEAIQSIEASLTEEQLGIVQKMATELQEQLEKVRKR